MHRKLLPTQAGTFDGQFGILVLENPLMLVQINKITGRYEVVRTVSEESTRLIVKARSRKQLKSRRLRRASYANAAVTDSSTTSSRRLQDTPLDTPLFFDEDDPTHSCWLASACAPMVDIYATMGTFVPSVKTICHALPTRIERDGIDVQWPTRKIFMPSMSYHLPSLCFAHVWIPLFLFSKGRAGGYMKRIVHCWKRMVRAVLNSTLDRMVQQQYDRRCDSNGYEPTQHTGRVVIPTVQNVLAGTRLPLSSPIENAGRSIVVLRL
jgi:hypothetical protein